jgi:hypothetical protein
MASKDEEHTGGHGHGRSIKPGGEDVRAVLVVEKQKRGPEVFLKLRQFRRICPARFLPND